MNLNGIILLYIIQFMSMTDDVSNIPDTFASNGTHEIKQLCDYILSSSNLDLLSPDIDTDMLMEVLLLSGYSRINEIMDLVVKNNNKKQEQPTTN